MRASSDSAVFPVAVIGLFLLLALAFWQGWWAGPVELAPLEPIDAELLSTDPVRESAAFLIRTDGDVSMFACYSCHVRDEPFELEFDEEGFLVIEEHQLDFDLAHGRNHRNDNCFNCHAQSNLEKLQTRDGRLLGLEQGTQLCGSCHGTNYRDWEAGIHGRTSGFWNVELGEAIRQDCTACHDPHRPAFPSLEPAPGPRRATLLMTRRTDLTEDPDHTEEEV
jgi:hypothetical protein